VGSVADRGRLDRTDASPRLRRLGGTGRRLGRRAHRRDRCQEARGVPGRPPHQPGPPPVRGATSLHRSARAVVRATGAALRRRTRGLLPPAADPAADDRLRPVRLARRARLLGVREVPRLDGQHQQPGDRPDPRRDARHLDLLVHQHRRLLRPAVLGGPARRRPRTARRRTGGVQPLPPRHRGALASHAGERFTPIVRWREIDRGGHFAAFEQPALFVDEVRAGLRALRGVAERSS
jgi:hypothetical protein